FPPCCSKITLERSTRPSKVESLLSEVFETSEISYHQISSRAKTIESVKAKGNNEKYSDPINEIQDFSGIRIITYVEDEIDSICKIIEENFEIDLENSSNKSDELGIDKVGYKSVHYVATLKKDRLKLPEYKQFQNKLFEIQIRTILQHAWAEIEHDRNYKFSGKLPPDISRRFKILAGVLEMSDREFNNISQEIDTISEKAKATVTSGKLNVPITSVSIAQYIKSKFKNKLSSGYEFIADHEAKGINELEKCGVTTLEELDLLLTEDAQKLYFYMASIDNKKIAELGIARISLILSDYKQYFSLAFSNSFGAFTYQKELEAQVKEIFERNKVDWDDITSNYNVSLMDI
ncbi:hypothetical protein V6255_17775, partial [Psychromonas arctica]